MEPSCVLAEDTNMSETIQLTIPRQWVQDLSLDQEQLRQALMLGLAQLQKQNKDIVLHRQQIRETLLAAGLSLPAVNVPPVAPPLTAKRQEELAQLFSTGRPLSEWILEEREAH
jgi:hypothetical protein